MNSKEADLFLQLGSEYYKISDSFTTLVASASKTTSIYAAAPVLNSQNQRIGMVCLLMPIGYLDSYISRLRWILLAATLVVILMGAGGSTLLTNYFTRQFSRVQALAATVAEGDYHLRIPEEGPTELRDLSRYLKSDGGETSKPIENAPELSWLM